MFHSPPKRSRDKKSSPHRRDSSHTRNRTNSLENTRNKKARTEKRKLSDTEKEPEKITKCGKCKKTLESNDKKCDCCERSYHASCVGLTKEELAAMKILGKKNIWYCPECDTGAAELHRQNILFKKRVDKLDVLVSSISQKLVNEEKSIEVVKTDLSVLQSDVKTAKSNIQKLQDSYETASVNIETNFNDIATNTNNITSLQNQQKRDKENMENLQNQLHAAKIRITANEEQLKTASTNKNDKTGLSMEDVKKYVDEAIAGNKSKNFPPLLNPDSDMDVDGADDSGERSERYWTSKFHSFYNERKEIERRKLQLIITNLKEFGNPENDKKELKEMLKMIQVQGDIKIEEVYRLGARSDKPRVLRVHVKDLTTKRNILAKAPELRKIPEDHKFAKVYVKPNLTPKQQEASRALEAKLKEKRDNDPTKNWIIKKGVIIEKPSQ